MSTTEKRPRRRRKIYLSLIFVTLASLLAVGVWRVVQESFESPVVGEDPMKVKILALEHRVASLESQVGALADARGEKVTIVESSEGWWITEVERYLAEADERVRNGADIKSALAALKAARNTLAAVSLQASDFPSIDKIRDTLDMEIELLGVYRNHGAKRAAALIDGIVRRLGNDESSGKKQSAPTDLQPTTKRGGLWESLIGHFRRVVTVETQAGDELWRFRQGLLVHSLMLARTAALSGDARAYRHAVTNAMRLFEHGETFNHETYEELRTLEMINVTPLPPPIGKALGEIRLFATEVLP